MINTDNKHNNASIRCLPGNNGKRTPILVQRLDYIKRSLDLLEYRIYIEIK